MLVHPDRIKIVFGTECNSECSYCYIQKNIRQGYNISNDFLANLKHYISLYHPLLVYFGGEPLLYWDKFKWLIQNIGDYDRHKMITNGKLLNEDIVDFCNEHNIEIYISTDLSPNGILKPYDFINDILFYPLNDESIKKINLLKNINKLCLSTVCTKYSEIKPSLFKLKYLLNNKSIYCPFTLVHSNNDIHPNIDDVIHNKIYLHKEFNGKYNEHNRCEEKEYIPPINLGSDNIVRYTIDGTILGEFTSIGIDINIKKYKNMYTNKENYKRCGSFLCISGNNLEKKCNPFSHENLKECVIRHECINYVNKRLDEIERN